MGVWIMGRAMSDDELSVEDFLIEDLSASITVVIDTSSKLPSLVGVRGVNERPKLVLSSTLLTSRRAIFEVCSSSSSTSSSEGSKNSLDSDPAIPERVSTIKELPGLTNSVISPTESPLISLEEYLITFTCIESIGLSTSDVSCLSNSLLISLLVLDDESNV